MSGQRHTPAALPPGKCRCPLYRRLCGPQRRSERVWKISLPGFDPRTVQPVASHYTDYAILAPLDSRYGQQVIFIITLSTLPNNEEKLISVTQNTERSIYVSTNFNSSHCNKTIEESTFPNLQTNISIHTPATSKRASGIVSATNTIYVA